MPDELDDVTWPSVPKPDASGAGSRADPVPRLIARIYAAGDASLRARLLQRLLDPLGTLGLAVVAAGAFASYLQRRGAEGIRVTLDDVSRHSSEQIAELVRFVGQVSPEAVQEVALAIADNPVGIAALGASALVLLMRALGRAEPGEVARRRAAGAPIDQMSGSVRRLSRELRRGSTNGSTTDSTND